jgi:hypothetical protein
MESLGGDIAGITLWCGVVGVRVRVVRDHSDWTTKEKISRKKRKEEKEKHTRG